MGDHSVVPDHHGLGLPSNPALQVLRERYVVIQEFEKIVAFFLLKANDISRELRVHIQSFLPCGRVSADDGVNGTDRLSSDVTAFVQSTLGLFVARVYGFETMKAFTERGRKSLIGGCLIDNCSQVSIRRK